MFTRQEVCALADIPVERFKTMIRRDQLPTVLSRRRQRSVSLSLWRRPLAIAIQESLSRNRLCRRASLDDCVIFRIVAYNCEIIRDVLHGAGASWVEQAL